MDLWQFSCYLDGFDARCRQQELDYLKLAVRFATYNNATRRTSLDAQSQAKELKDDMYRLLTDDCTVKSNKTKEECAKEEIDLLKKNLKYFD